ncbi:5-formyltetrahydrofolate cyclo-ligase [Mycolicibacterium vanbaalenii]|uniref:5-formyltetrahydrofolate cyclo-ligase n=1 Tax=Mycolicibacterium vanbaalenii TaxID=110539 RepID=A0A5S9R8Y4_MYCVN|nr:5-formyltetrahydrofolate cyclo-ligase [Mycolicibacterium vanbaalenii]CAA0132361.1 5-formyltetrahydrofolate cyclo-ligase [Mycolicibacterium vanbaalenii]
MQSTKAQVRGEILAARRSVPPPTHAAEAAALASHVLEFVEAGQTVCGYVPVGSEPGSAELIDGLARHQVTVLLPVARRASGGAALPLRWGRYRPGELVDAPFGLREPPQPWLPAGAVAEAAVVLIPALAVDRRGTRLGRGAGFYDRTLPLADDGAALVAVVRDDELVDHLPSEPHDVRVTHALTPRQGLVTLGR